MVYGLLARNGMKAPSQGQPERHVHNEEMLRVTDRQALAKGERYVLTPLTSVTGFQSRGFENCLSLLRRVPSVLVLVGDLSMIRS